MNLDNKVKRINIHLVSRDHGIVFGGITDDTPKINHSNMSYSIISRIIRNKIIKLALTKTNMEDTIRRVIRRSCCYRV